ncbi:MAG: hypothetical protein ACT4NX_08160 [Deltaproteobacteria bacterium]
MERESKAQVQQKTHRDVLELIEQERFILLIRGKSIESVLEATDAARNLGFRLVGWDFQTPEVQILMKSLKKQGGGANVGVFNVSSAKEARLAVNRGARFVFLTHLDGGALKKCRAERVFHAAGALTAGEIAGCLERRADAVSLFPARAAGGAAGLELLARAFAKANIIPTDATSPAESLEYLRAGAYAVAPIIEAREFDAASEILRGFAEIKLALEK